MRNPSSGQNVLIDVLDQLNQHLQEGKAASLFKPNKLDIEESNQEHFQKLISIITRKENEIVELQNQKNATEKELQAVRVWATGARDVFLELQRNLIYGLSSDEQRNLIKIGNRDSEYDSKDIDKIKEQSVKIIWKFRDWRKAFFPIITDFLHKEQPARANFRDKYRSALEQIDQSSEFDALAILRGTLKDLISHTEDQERNAILVINVLSDFRPNIKTDVSLLVNEIAKEVRLGRNINKEISRLYSNNPDAVEHALEERNETEARAFVRKYEGEVLLLADSKAKLISLIDSCPSDIKAKIPGAVSQWSDWAGIGSFLAQIFQSLSKSYKEMVDVKARLLSKTDVAPFLAPLSPMDQLDNLLQSVDVAKSEIAREKNELVQTAKRLEALLQQWSRAETRKMEAAAEHVVDGVRLSSLERQLHAEKHEHRLKEFRVENLANDLRKVYEASTALLTHNQQLQAKLHTLQRLAALRKEAPALEAWQRQELLRTVQRQQALLHARERLGSLDRAAVDIARADRQHDRRLARIEAWNYFGLALAFLGVVFFFVRWLAGRRL